MGCSQTSLLISCSRDGDYEGVVSALEQGIDPNFQDWYRYTALMKASSRGHIKIVELLLKHGANLDLNIYGDTALMQASIEGHFSIVELLLEYGANPNLRDKSETTALWCASWCGHDEIVKLLLEHRVDSK